MFIVWISVLKILVEKKKWYLRLYLTQIMHSNGKILFPWRKNVYQSFYNAPLTFGSFSSRKSCVSARVSKSFAKCFNCLKILVEKTEISGYIWHKSFIQTVKCSSFYQRIVYQSFTGASLNFSYFFSSRKSYITMRRQVACEMFIVWSVPKTLSKKWYLRLYLTQTVHSNSKMLFL